MRWSVTYWHAPGHTTTTTSTNTAWANLPTTNVAWVHVQHDEYRQTLAGMDYYWMASDGRFGAFNDPSNWRSYGGGPTAQYKAWAWNGSGFAVANPIVPEGAHVIAGVMIPDAEWAALRGH